MNNPMFPAAQHAGHRENVAVIPKASSEEHVRDNLAAADLELDADDIALIESIEREYRVIDPIMLSGIELPD